MDLVEFKALTDEVITNKDEPNTITPEMVGTIIKTLADLVGVVLVENTDALIIAGYEATDTDVYLTDSSWRVGGFTYVLPAAINYDIPAPPSGGLTRIDRIIGKSNGFSEYLTGVAAESAIAPEMPANSVLIVEILSSAADVVIPPPPPPVTTGAFVKTEGFSIVKEGAVRFNPTTNLQFSTGNKGQYWIRTSTADDLLRLSFFGWDGIVDLMTFNYLTKEIVFGGGISSVTIDGKVDKVAGKSLLADAEIARLLTLENVDISGKVDKTTETTGVALTFLAERVYGSIATPETGNITANVAGAVLGTTNIVVHNHSAAPTFDAKFKKLSGSGDYIVSVVNYIICVYINATEIIYSINQRV